MAADAMTIAARQRYPLSAIYHGDDCPSMRGGACKCGATSQYELMKARHDAFIAGWETGCAEERRRLKIVSS
jgi:hypothetical protein